MARTRSRTAKQPWFNFSAGSSFYHSDKVWLENLDIPFGFLASYIAKVRKGESLERPMAGGDRRARPDRVRVHAS